MTDPYHYVELFSELADSRKVVRYLVAGTEINAQVVIESLDYREKDGSGDVYYTLSLAEWVDLEAVTVSGAAIAGGTGGTGNGKQTSEQQTQSYIIVSGDMLSVICRRYYGNGSAAYYNALAAYNGIVNPHLIYPGDTVLIPPALELLGGKS